MNERVLVLGASGYVGGRLVPRLLEAGYAVRCLARSPGKLRAAPWGEDAEIVGGDLLEGSDADLDAAFADVGAVFHLVHSMGKVAGFASADRRIAARVAAAAERAGARRIVYLGGLGDVDADTSDHLRSRAEVAETLRDGSVPVTVLRAAIIIGSGSASFEMLRHLVEKLPAMVTPRWVRTRVQPIAIRDVLRYLVGVLDATDDADHVYDIGGPDVLTYLAMMREYAEAAGLTRRLVVNVPFLTPTLSSHWINFVTPVPVGLAKPLVRSLASEVVVQVDDEHEDVTAVVPGACLSYRRALELALTRIRDHDVETSWRDAEIGGRSPADPYPGDPEWSGGTLLRDVRTGDTGLPAAAVFGAVVRIGGARGWPTYGWAWRLRGRMDRFIGGIGLRRGRRDPDRLRVGDALDFWRVEEVRPPDEADERPEGVLRLRAEMKLPGLAWLEFRVTGHDPEADGRTRLVQRALFAPRGVLGRAYWYALLPAHAFIFASMPGALIRAAGLDGSASHAGNANATRPPQGLVERPG